MTVRVFLAPIVTPGKSRRRATLIRAAQDAATQYSPPTGDLLETLVREVSCDNAERVLELARRIDDDATTAAYQSLIPNARGADPRAVHDGVA